MKVLLDECVNRRLKRHLTDIEVYTVADMNWLSLRNGNLMRAAIEDGFDVLLTIDKNLEYQHDLRKYNIAIVVFDVLKNSLQYLEEVVLVFKAQLPTFQKGVAYRIRAPNA